MIDWGRLELGFWFQNHPTSLVWDAVLNAALDEFGVSDIKSHSVKVGPFTVWVGNYPYEYGKQSGPVEVEVLPTVRTRKRLYNAVLQASMDLARTTIIVEKAE
jgi:hypothetical protein